MTTIDPFDPAVLINELNAAMISITADGQIQGTSDAYLIAAAGSFEINTPDIGK